MRRAACGDTGRCSATQRPRENWSSARSRHHERVHLITLGYNYSQMHDSSACIVRDGEVLYAVAEERLSRVKHDAGFPHRAIRACLDFAGIAPDQVDEICQGWPRPWHTFATDLRCY